MEWSIGESGVRYTAKLSDSEGTLSLAGLTRDGHEAPHSEIGITRDSQGARLLVDIDGSCLLYTSPSPRDVEESRMPSSA